MAITDGAQVIRQHLFSVFGVMLIIILDWYHLGKKVRDLMSMIARNKDEKNLHLKFIFYHLWRGEVYTVMDYLEKKVQPKNQEKHRELINYLNKHRDEIIDYRRRKKVGKMMGSGCIAFLYRLWNTQVPMGFFKIKNLFVEEIEKATFNLHKCFIFKKMPTQEVFSL